MKIDHIAIAVNDVEASAKVYQKALGIDEIEFETVETEGVKVAIIPMENGRIELMQPTNDSSPIKKFLEKKGQGLHHMALETDDIDGEVVSIIKVGIVNVFDTLPAESVTVIVLSLYSPSNNSSNVMVLSPFLASVVDVKLKLELMVPSSVV